MRPVTVGIVAHVDAGKTTLSEALLYETGAIRNLGRVDHGTSFLDHDAMEREHGITIFSKQAVLQFGDTELTLLDTPGHTDFSAETERVFSVLDLGILVISALDGVQSHTLSLWRLLERYNVPTIVFINKIDIMKCRIEDIVQDVRHKLSENIIPLWEDPWEENASLCGEGALEEFLETGHLSEKTCAALVGERKFFPCFSGSALKQEGIKELLSGVTKYAPEKQYKDAFAARVFKISTDQKGQRLTHLKLTGGKLAPKQLVGEEKTAEIRLYSGTGYRLLTEALPGQVVAVTGLNSTSAGQGLGEEKELPRPWINPVISVAVLLPTGVSRTDAYRKMASLSEELPELGLVWEEEKEEIRIRSMGEMQNEIFQRLVKDRLGFVINFGPGQISYRETISNTVTGIGHFEPLRHFAEVRLRLSPGERGSGLTFETDCPVDTLALNWQRLILTHLKEKTHVGVLTGSPITDMKITVIGGRAHLKHTEGGDFRQATYRAVRQGLKKAESVLLEPWYAFTMILPAESLGHAMTDLSERGCEFDPPEQSVETAEIKGFGPVAALSLYPGELQRYTAGKGSMTLAFDSYRPCKNAEEVIREKGYDSEEDEKNPTASVFCAHGAGFMVPWDEVENYVRDEDGDLNEMATPAVFVPKGAKAKQYGGTYEEDLELEAIFEREFGPLKRKLAEDYYEKPEKFSAPATGKTTEDYKKKKAKPKEKKEILLVDGYNLIHAWPELKSLSEADLGAARDALADKLCNYQGYTGAEVILVFDAYRRAGSPGHAEHYLNIFVVYTKEGETADMYIEKTTRALSAENRVRVVTSDALEQTLVLGGGGERVSAREFILEMEAL